MEYILLITNFKITSRGREGVQNQSRGKIILSSSKNTFCLAVEEQRSPSKSGDQTRISP